jgi:hypothetical protein
MQRFDSFDYDININRELSPFMTFPLDSKKDGDVNIHYVFNLVVI